MISFIIIGVDYLKASVITVDNSANIESQCLHTNIVEEMLIGDVLKLRDYHITLDKLIQEERIRP